MKAIDEPAEEPRRRGRPKVSTDEDKRVQIVEVARRVFVKYGYAGSTTAVVASEAGVSKQTLYRLFESKEELFAAVVAAYRRLMLDLPRPAEDCSIAESLERIFMLDMDEDRDADRAGFLQLVFREAAQFPELVDILQREGMLASRQELADWLSDRRAEGRLTLDDPLSGARMLMDMIFGGMGPPEGRAQAWPERAALLAHLRRSIAIFAAGIGAA
ncbi:TetR family transcription regulator protein (plasmid) [Rhizobium phaseoli]|uniref:TetR family transcription regulator protein n=1 Tax=Rhizobium phaseoli TaxID=396 RepID=A0A192TMG5_9HYPH|nr:MULTISPECIES: TetR/AcrR family transcriptional regulator [Rhizobium]KEC70255.1 TetR family calsymin transcriptional regulator [Rhizobium leguminosarum bv. phaseoli CCGM1]MDH6646200.1 AcrR family transcriptional regulator [Rhizobium esperanzae]ANL44308.1 TetR family transcription regulator protein [Rhizobium phaseoli]ANL56849.1 TetR family transcription regulator protein [Rhizobium phaseoli]ANL63272.1 TetR family transcription regulator protein [Rhizobium phaseoli]